jgi:hypothetical protein
MHRASPWRTARVLVSAHSQVTSLVEQAFDLASDEPESGFLERRDIAATPPHVVEVEVGGE